VLDGAKAVYKAVTSAEQHFEKAAQHFINYMKTNDPAEYEAAQNEVNLASQDVTNFSMAGAKAEIKKRMLALTDDVEKAEHWIENHWYEVAKKAEKFRQQNAPKVKAGAKWLWLKVVGGVAVAAAFVAVSIGGYNFGQGGQQVAGNIEAQEKLAEQERQFNQQMQDFNRTVESLQAPVIPDISPYAQPIDAAQAVMPQVVAQLPAPVAQVAIQPVELTLTTPTVKGDQTQTVTTTMGQLWVRGDRETKERVEKAAQEPPAQDYVYAFQQKGSCTQTDCLGQHKQNWDGRKGVDGVSAEQH
jgi:hypothetical protein